MQCLPDWWSKILSLGCVQCRYSNHPSHLPAPPNILHNSSRLSLSHPLPMATHFQITRLALCAPFRARYTSYYFLALLPCNAQNPVRAPDHLRSTPRMQLFLPLSPIPNIILFSSFTPQVHRTVSCKSLPVRPLALYTRFNETN